VNQLGERPLIVGAPASLSGRYHRQGRLAASAIQQAVEDVARRGGVQAGAERLVPQAAVLDDGSTRAGVRRALDYLERAELLVGPYGNDLMIDAASWAEGRPALIWNHGASADDVQRLRSLVSVSSPASRYLASVLEALAGQMPGARVVVAARPSAFGRAAARGVLDAASRLGFQVERVVSHEEVGDAPDEDVLLAAGSFEDDVGLLKKLARRPSAVALVAGGLGDFVLEAGTRAEGVLAPSQWEEGIRVDPDTGPHSADVVRALRARLSPVLGTGRSFGVVDYPAAQAYAAVVLALRCVEEAGSPEAPALKEVAKRLRCTTFFGRFGLGDDGRQSEHDLVVVQWHEGAKHVVWPPGQARAQLRI
jgi:branched-chain amino acid transport system substrate-binding protein